MSIGGPDCLLTRISTRAASDLEEQRGAARFWRALDMFLLLPAAAAAAVAALLGPTGAIEAPVAVGAAVVAAVLAGISIVFDIPGRARRAEVAAVYLEAFVAESDGVPDTDEAAVDLRRWFVRINVAITMGGLDVDPDLLEPCPPGSGHCPPEDDADAGSEPAANGMTVVSVANGKKAPAATDGKVVAARHGVRGLERAGERHRHRLWWAFLLAAVFLAVEAGAAFVTNSLSLLSDAGHVLADGVGLGLALAAVHLASHGARHPSRTFGMYRLEIVAALANAVILMGVAGYVLVEAVRRIGDPPAVPGGVVLLVALAGLAANAASYWLLRPGAAESLNVRAAYLDVVADAIASIGVLVGGVAIRFTGWTWIDLVVGAAIGLWILPRAWTLGREAFRVVVQAAPPEVDMATVEADLRSLPGVEGVHRLHLWTLTSDLEVASAHLIVRPDADLHDVLDQAQLLLQDRYHVAHTTLQLEDDGKACADLDW